MRPRNRIFRVNYLLGALRATSSIHALAVLSQAVYAGQFLSGDEGPVRVHELSGWAILILAAVQLAFSISWNKLRGQAFWLVLSGIGVLLAEMLQLGTGYARFQSVHIPLGVLIFGAVSWQTIQLFKSEKGYA